VFVSTFLWPISAYKRVKIEIATAVERMTECLQNTEPYIIDDVVSSARNAAKVPPSGAKADEALHPVSAETSNGQALAARTPSKRHQRARFCE